MNRPRACWLEEQPPQHPCPKRGQKFDVHREMKTNGLFGSGDAGLGVDILELRELGAACERRLAGVAGTGMRKMTARVTVDEVERVAELAHLKLTSEETGRMLKDLNAILDYIAELNEVDTQRIAPLAQVSELSQAGPAAPRPDELRPSLDRAVVMAGAPETNGAFFKVPKVIER